MRRHNAAVVALLALLAGTAGCRPAGGAARVAQLRARHAARLEGFVVRQRPAPAASSDVVLDLTLRRDGDEALPGITLEVALLGPHGKEKQHYRIWIATPALAGGAAVPVSYALEDVPYQAGDVFTVEVRAAVPAAERGLYREFAGGGSTRAAPPT